MGEEPKPEMSEDARKSLADALRDAVMDTQSTEIVAESVHTILADIDSNLQMSIENARLRQMVEKMESDLKEMKKDLKVQKMLRGMAEAHVKRLKGTDEEEPDNGDEPEEDTPEEEETESFFDEPDSSSMEVVKGIILDTMDAEGGWATIQIVKDEASLIDVGPDDVDAIISYWQKNEAEGWLEVDDDKMKVRIKE
jgi:hypothetical protein